MDTLKCDVEVLMKELNVLFDGLEELIATKQKAKEKHGAIGVTVYGENLGDGSYNFSMDEDEFEKFVDGKINKTYRRIISTYFDIVNKLNTMINDCEKSI